MPLDAACNSIILHRGTMIGKDDLLKALGRKVRHLRQASGWSIERLAAASDLSPRFLSDIEAGRGNVSIARLWQIAAALQQPVQLLIPAAEENLSLRGRIWTMLDGCQPKDLDALHTWLSARRQRSRE